MNDPHSGTGKVWLAVLTVILLLVIVGTGANAFLRFGPPVASGRPAPPTAAVPRGSYANTPPARPSAREEEKLWAFLDGATSPDPAVREATLRNESKMQELRWTLASAPKEDEPQFRRVVQSLRERLKDESPAVRLAAVEAVIPIDLGPWTTNPPDGLKPEDAVPVGEALLTEKDPALRLRAAVLLWARKESASAGRVLVSVVRDANAPLADRQQAAKAMSYRTLPPGRPEGMAEALAGVIADPAAPAELRTTAAAQIGDAGDEMKRKVGSWLRDKLHVLTDGKLPGDVRVECLNWVIPTDDKTPLPDGLREVLVTLAENADTAVPVRVRAFGLLGPHTEPFAKEHPTLAKQLQSAVPDAKQDPAFRAFAAYHYWLDSPDKFATAVRLLTEPEDNTVALRWALAGRMAAQFPKGKRPPNEWVTATVIKQLTACPSTFPVPDNVRFYHDSDYRRSAGDRVWWPGDFRPNSVEGLFDELLATRWEEVVKDLLDPAKSVRVRSRNEQVVRRVMKEHPTALWKALMKLVNDAGADEAVRTRALTWLYAEDAAWPEEVSVSWSDRLAAKDATREERRLILKWQVSQARTPIDGYRALLRSQRGAARVLVVEEVGRQGQNAKDAIPELIQGLKDEYPTAPAPYVSALAAIGPDSIPALGELMKEKEAKLRIAAAEALGLIGPEGRSKATPILRTAVEQEKDDAVKMAALEALGQVNPAEAKKLGWTTK